MYILENGKVLAEGSAVEIIQRYAPAKLRLKNRLDNQTIEINGIDSQEAMDYLSTHRSTINSFEYQQGSIGDAFIKITGKELQ